jgi:hypothetical protein
VIVKCGVFDREQRAGDEDDFKLKSGARARVRRMSRLLLKS